MIAARSTASTLKFVVVVVVIGVFCLSLLA